MSLEFNILIAEDNPGDARPLKRIIKFELAQKIQGVEIHVHIVDSLKRARELKEIANMTILDLNLTDAGPEQVIAAISEFTAPVLIMTGDNSPETYAKCKLAGASLVLIKGHLGDGAIGAAILHCLSKDVVMSVEDFHHPKPETMSYASEPA